MLFMHINSFDPYNNLMKGHYISPTLAMKKKKQKLTLKDLPGVTPQAKESANTINETFWLRYMVLTPPPTPPHPFKNSYWLHPHFPFLSSNSFHLISLASSSLVTASSVALTSLALRDVTVTCQARVLPDV